MASRLRSLFGRGGKGVGVSRVQQPDSSGALAAASRHHVPVVTGYPIIACAQSLRSFACFKGQCHTLSR